MYELLRVHRTDRLPSKNQAMSIMMNDPIARLLCKVASRRVFGKGPMILLLTVHCLGAGCTNHLPPEAAWPNKQASIASQTTRLKSLLCECPRNTISLEGRATLLKRIRQDCPNSKVSVANQMIPRIGHHLKWRSNRAFVSSQMKALVKKANNVVKVSARYNLQEAYWEKTRTMMTKGRTQKPV